MVRHDRFAQSTSCSLSSKDGRILYQPAALGFRFAHRADTLEALYRIDGGSPQRWQDDYPALIASGARIDGSGLDTPTEGIVWVPVNDVVTARTVSIRLHAHDRVHAFALRGFALMLAASRRLGCTTDASFAS